MYTAAVPYSHLYYKAKWKDARGDHQVPSTKIISLFHRLALVNARFLLPF